jgi:hypothetical protein
MKNKLVIAMAFLCAATVANADEGGMKIGARLGYSIQSIGSKNWGYLGFAAGAALNVPAGPVVVAPEVAFLYRNNSSAQATVTVGSRSQKSDITMPEMAISIPVIIKYAINEKMYGGAGIQIDLPIGAEYCIDDWCTEMDGGRGNRERSAFDLGFPFAYGYMVLPNLAVDARYVIGVIAHSKFNTVERGEVDSDPVSTFSVNATYFF